MSTRRGIDEILRMIDSLVHKTLRRQTVISTPAVRIMVVLGRVQFLMTDSSVSESRDGTFKATENPKPIYPAISVIFAMTTFSFINFNDHT